MTLFSGDIIDRYVIEEALGAGGMGEVYRARDTRLHRSVALKILRPAAVTGGDATHGTGPTDGAARMIREARAAAALDHPNVIAIYDVGQLDDASPLAGTTYIAMELIKGRTLRAFVGDTSVPTEQRIRWLVDVASALGAAHAAGLVHRDIKPDNVMVRDDGVVKVLDFGIARRAQGDAVDPSSSTEGLSLQAVTAQGVVIGTPLYMAPEQMRGEPVDGRCDQFSWGVVAYELLTGAPPWSRDAGTIALLSQILSSKPRTLDPFIAIPDHVKDAIGRALEKDRDARFPTMRELVEAIDREPSSAASSKNGAKSNASKSARRVDSASRRPISGAVAIEQTRRSGGLSPDESAETLLAGPIALPAPSPLDPRTGARAATEAEPEAAPPSTTAKRSRAWIPSVVSLLIIAALATVALVRARHRASTPSGNPAASMVVASAALPPCSSSACARAHGGQPWVCRASDHQCVAVASDDCTPKFDPDDLDRDDTVWIGAMVALKGARASTYPHEAQAIELARTQVAESTRVVERLPAGRGVHHLAIAMCDDSADAMRAATHLVDDVGVPAILGFDSPAEVIDLAGRLLLSRGILVVPTNTGNPMVTRLPQPIDTPRLVWRATYGLANTAYATAALIPKTIEPRLHASGTTSGPIRIALARVDSPGGFAFGEEFFRNLVFNGKSAVSNDAAYREVTFSPAANQAEIDALAARLITIHPDLIVTLGRSETTLALIKAVERLWDDHHGPRPTYLLADESVEDYLAFAGHDADRRHRILVVNPPLSTARGARFAMLFNQKFGSDPLGSVDPGMSYDAVFLVDLAMLAAGNAPITGASLSRGIGKLVPPGRAVDVGPDALLTAVTELGSGRPIDFQGASGDYDFDLTTGESPFDFELRCMSVDKDGAAGKEIPSGVAVRARTHGVEGTFHCP